jgi:hypothetical protein
MKVLVLGSFVWIVLVSAAAWKLNQSRWAHPETLTTVTAANLDLPQAKPAVARAPSLYFANPFDRSEVFEFPAGTSQAAARAAVAEFLIDRARGRITHLQHVTRMAEVDRAQTFGMRTSR